MISGDIEGDEGRIRLKVQGSRGREREIHAIVDTGYTASLTLPPALIVELGLKWRSVDRGILADGSECLCDVYEAKLVWDGETRHILVDEAATDPLIGMRLLRGNELNMQIRDGGKITIKRIP